MKMSFKIFWFEHKIFISDSPASKWFLGQKL